MNRWCALGLALLVALVLPAAAGQTGASHPDRLGFEIQVTPMTPPPGRASETRKHYMITTVVKRLETGEVLFAPQVAALSGIRASVSSSGQETSIQFKATFLVDDSSARYTVEATRAGEQLLSSTGAIELRREGADTTR